MLLSAPGYSAPEDLRKHQTQLRSLHHRIAEIEADMTATESEANRLQNELRRHETTINEALKNVRDLEHKISRKMRSLSKLNARRAERQAEFAEQKRLLHSQIVSAFLTSKNDYVKLLLNQQDPAQLGRVLVYHDYFNQARKQRLHALRTTLREIGEFEVAIGSETGELETLRNGQENRLKELERTAQARKTILAELKQQLQAQGNELQQLRMDEQHLNDLIKQLQRAVAAAPVEEAGARPFQQLKGKLSWPVPGKLLQRFGTPRNGGYLKWNGVVLKAAPGTQVRAIAHGTVIFSDWFRNMGMLIIIDHGSGFMTLYGHNQAVFKAAGDTVGSGDVIASVGDIGSGLYFEVRRQGKPLDPHAWCKPESTAQTARQ